MSDRAPDGAVTGRRGPRPDEVVHVGARASVVRGVGPAGTGWHAQPGWKLVVAHEGPVRVLTAGGTARAGACVVVPPGVPHRATTDGPYTGVLFEPGQLRAAPGGRPVVVLGARDVPGWALGPAAVIGDEEVDDLLGLAARSTGTVARPVDERIAEAVSRLATGPAIPELAAQVGVSAPHLRRLAQQELGVPLARVRNWRRLRAAFATGAPLGEAAVAAGFADQSHLSRAARALVGRTPGAVAAASVRAATGIGAPAQRRSPHGAVPPGRPA